MKKRLLCLFVLCGMLIFAACSSEPEELPGIVPEEATEEQAKAPEDIPGRDEETVIPGKDEEPVITEAPGDEPLIPGTDEDPQAPEDEPLIPGTDEEPEAPGDGPVVPGPDEGPEEEIPEDRDLEWDETWKYADHSLIHDDRPILYYSHAEYCKNIVVSVNAGHGTPGGNKVRTLCHPDGTAKVTGGSTAAGETTAAAVSSGTTLLDGTPEGEANLSLALILKELLLDEGYDVLMIREDNDTQLDNIARTVYSNNYADCHIAIHYDSSENDKGFFYIGVPDISSYRAMEPVASHWESHNALGEALLEGVKSVGVKICGSGNIPLDLTQTSYSTIPSIDVEVGDRGSDHSESTQRKIAEGLLEGVNIFFSE